MLKQFKKNIAHHYRIVKKFSSVFEARLAEEALNLYHIKTIVVKKYIDAHAQFKHDVQEIYLLVFPQDYQTAYRLLYV